MSFNFDKAFEVENGIILNNGIGLFSGVGSPVGTQADSGTYYFNLTDGLMWFKHGALAADWRQVRPEYFQDHNTIFTSNGSGQTFNKNVWERLALGHINGSNQEPNNTLHIWQIIADQSGNGSVDLRLYDVTNAAVLAGPINFTETTATYKQATFTPPAGDPVIEIQGIKNGNSTGEIFWSAAESYRTSI